MAHSPSSLKHYIPLQLILRGKRMAILALTPGVRFPQAFYPTVLATPDDPHSPQSPRTARMDTPRKLC